MIKSKHLVFIETNRSGLIALRTAKERGFKVTFIKADSNAYAYKGDDFEQVFQTLDRIITVENTLSEADVLTALQGILEQEPIDAVITVLQHCTFPLANTAIKLNLHYNYPEAVEAARNKFSSRTLLEQHKIPSAKYALVSSREEALEAANKVGFPMIVKPSCGSASLFVSVLQNSSDLLKAIDKYESGLSTLEPKFQSVLKNESHLLLEEYLSGRMLSVEAGINCGEFVVFTIGERHRCRYDETIEVGTTIPAPISNRQWSEVVEYAQKVTKTFGLNRGLFHIEIMLTESGPRLIEFNPRIMGGSLPLAYNYAHNINIYDYLIDAHLGQPFKPLPPTPTTYVTSRIFGSVEQKTAPSKFDLSWLNDYQKYDLRLELYIKPGAIVKKINSNFEYIGSFRLRANCAHKSNFLAEKILEKLSNTLRLTLTI